MVYKTITKCYDARTAPDFLPPDLARIADLLIPTFARNWHTDSHLDSCLAWWNQPCDTGVVKSKHLKQLSNLCFFLGFASILGSIAIWFLTGGTSSDTVAHAERFGIFVGLWAPTFLILSNRFDRYAERVV